MIFLTAALLLCVFAFPAPVEAAESVESAGAPVFALTAWISEILGNQVRMIQVGLVVIAIGIFLLTRSHK